MTAEDGRSAVSSQQSGNFEPNKTPNHTIGRFRFNSLTMSYFHTGIRTIIGAEAFHCPVRDGKEWYHLAMVVRHNFLSS